MEFHRNSLFSSFPSCYRVRHRTVRFQQHSGTALEKRDMTRGGADRRRDGCPEGPTSNLVLLDRYDGLRASSGLQQMRLVSPRHLLLKVDRALGQPNVSMKALLNLGLSVLDYPRRSTAHRSCRASSAGRTSVAHPTPRPIALGENNPIQNASFMTARLGKLFSYWRRRRATCSSISQITLPRPYSEVQRPESGSQRNLWQISEINPCSAARVWRCP